MNNEFGIVIWESKAVVSSRDVARGYENPHNDLLNTIRNQNVQKNLDRRVFSVRLYQRTEQRNTINHNI